MPTQTPRELISKIAVGSQVVVRDEEWLVTSTSDTPSDGMMVRCVGQSALVRDQEATFLTSLDHIGPLEPENTQLVVDDSPHFRRSRLYLEAVIRKTPVPATSSALAVSQHQLLNELQYQRRAVHKALDGLRPRLLIADAVGLGKTLEVGMILSELVRRGRGERILVVTPRHILEQFQHELWTRFAIPLIRLDSEGISRVQRQIPGNRNPFTHYKRVIISIDTLKNAGRYRHHLEGIHWDAVVIDECHNLVNRGTLNNQLARVLAPRTEALLLTSATPHNGDPKSFAELIRLLDPTAIVDPSDIKPTDIEHLYVRRHKQHPEVALELGDKWADRLPPKAVMVSPTLQESALLNELREVWLHPTRGSPPVSGPGSTLFPWTLLKAALSSHRALAETVKQRCRNIGSQSAEGMDLSEKQQLEADALASLGQHCEAIESSGQSKLERLVADLNQIGIGPRSKTRVVIFSERIATLDWLAEELPARLILKPENVAVLHGGMTDIRQMDVIGDFGLESKKVRVLLTGDMASEGVNLHRQCHHLIHFDLPWSLITIEQRNGRIDRYGQEHQPDIRALLMAPDDEEMASDLRVLEKLLQREDEAHRAFGDSARLFGLHDAAEEEKEIIQRLINGVDADEIVPAEAKTEFDLLAMITSDSQMSDAPTQAPPTLFESPHVFVDEAMRLAYGDALKELEARTDSADPTFVSIEPPSDLVKRLRLLPQSYLVEQKITERLQLTGDQQLAELKLAEANRGDSLWPEIGLLSPLHPFIDWAVDKVLVGVDRNTAPVITADVKVATFLVQGMYSNGAGRPQLVEWLAIDPIAGTAKDMFELLDQSGVGPTMTNPGNVAGTDEPQTHVREAVALAKRELAVRRDNYDEVIRGRLEEPRNRLTNWFEQLQLLESQFFATPTGKRSAEERLATRHRVEREIKRLETTGEPLVRVLGVLVPRGGP